MFVLYLLGCSLKVSVCFLAVFFQSDFCVSATISMVSFGDVHFICVLLFASIVLDQLMQYFILCTFCLLLLFPLFCRHNIPLSV